MRNKNRTVTIVQYAGSDRVSLIGPHGTAVLRNDNPVEIGIAAMELLTGHKICPPASYRKNEEGGEG